MSNGQMTVKQVAKDHVELAFRQVDELNWLVGSEQLKDLVETLKALKMLIGLMD